MGEGRQETALGLGERLRSARKAQAMSLEQAASALRLEASVLQALEEDRFAAVGAPVFVRGHLKAYARLLGLTEGAVLGAYRSAAPDSDNPPRVTRDREKPLSPGPGPAGIVALVAVVLVIIGSFWWLSDGGPPTAVITDPGAAAPSLPPAVEPAAPVTDSVPPAAPLPSPAGGAADPAPPAESRLTLDFTESAWVEVSNDTGRLLAGEQPAGTRQEITGVPPFDVVIGNYPGVRLALDGIAVAPPESARTPGSTVVRFRVPASSAVDAPAVEAGPAPAPDAGE